MITKLFIYLYKRTSFGGAIAIFTTTWSLIASFHGFYFFYSLVNLTMDELLLFLILLMVCTMFAILLHLAHFGIFYKLGLPGFTRKIRMINRNFDNEYIFSNNNALVNKSIKEVYTAISSLSVNNLFIAIIYTAMVVMVMATITYIYFNDFEKATISIIGGIFASLIIGYCTSLITEYFTGSYRVRLQQILFQRSIHFQTKNILSFKIKSIFILFLVLSSMIILMILISRSERMMFQIAIFIILSLSSVGLLIFLIINTINISLSNINDATKNLASGGGGMFFPPFSDKEFIIFSKNYNHAALEINAIRTDLESKVGERTEELRVAYENLNKAYGQIQTDLNLAQRIQKRIMPENFRGIEGLDIAANYYPMTDIGGDIYDILQLRPGYVRIFLADAIGHGIQAALITMLIKGEYEKVKNIEHPHDLMKKINESFIEVYYTLNAFFSCIVLDIDIEHKKIRYASAGHPDQIHICDDSIEMLSHTGKLIGITKKAQYEMIEKNIHYHDKIMLFTDGLYEQYNNLYEGLTEKGLHELIEQNISESIHGLHGRIIARIRDYFGDDCGIAVSDDITLISIELNERAHK